MLNGHRKNDLHMFNSVTTRWEWSSVINVFLSGKLLREGGLNIKFKVKKSKPIGLLDRD